VRGVRCASVCKRAHQHGAAACPRPDLARPRTRSSLSVGNGRKLAERMLKLRAKCDNVWAVITLDGCYLEQVGRLIWP